MFDSFLALYNEVTWIYIFIKFQAWSDEFLRWNPEEHNDVQNLAISASKIWIPDINLYEK